MTAKLHNGPTMLHVLADHAARFPEKTCLIQAETGQTCSYGRFWRAINGFCARLRELGVCAGDAVVVRCEQNISFFVVAYAIQLLGGIYVPAEKGVAENRLKEIMELTDARFLIATRPVSFPCVFIEMRDIENCDSESENPEFPPPDQLCEILFTTGTTGKSKGVMLSCINDFSAAENIADYQAYTEKDVVMVPLPLNHAGGWRRSNAALLAGATVVVANGVVFLKNFFQAIETYRVTVLGLVPAHLALLLDNAAEELGKFSAQLRVVAIGGAATPEPHKQRLRQLLPNTRLFLCYGASEAGAICSFDFSKDDRPHCIGRPNKNAAISFVDKEWRTVSSPSTEVPAQIACEGPMVMMGYWREPQLTKTVLQNGKLMLADLGYVDADGLVYLAGRSDDVIISGGNKIAPAEIEDLVLRLPGILECACVGVPDETLGKVPKLFVVAAPGAALEPKEILTYLTNHLELFKVPRQIVQLRSLPKVGAAQKLDRKALREM